MATTRQFVVIMYDSRRVTTFQQNPAVVPFRLASVTACYTHATQWVTSFRVAVNSNGK